MCVFLSFFFIFCDFRFYTSNKHNDTSKNLKSDFTHNWNAFWKLLFKINAKFQRISKSHFRDISKIPPVALGILLSV